MHSSRPVHLLGLCASILSVICPSNAAWIDGDNLQEDLLTMVNQGIGALAWQNYFDTTVSFTPDMPKGQDILDQISSQLNKKFTKRLDQVKALKKNIEDNYGSYGYSATMPKCCQLTGLKYSASFRMNINKDTSCVQVSATAESMKKYPNAAFTNKVKSNLNQDSSLKWQYFGDENGVMTMFPANKFTDCDSYDPRYRPWYVGAATPTKKEVVIVIDKSGSMGIGHNGQTLMSIAKKAGITVLETLGPDDLVGVVGFSSRSYMEAGCYSDSMSAATPQNVKKLKEYVNRLSEGGSTSYTSALTSAFRLLEKSSDMAIPGQTREKVILFLTDGAPSESSKSIMDMLKVKNAQMNNKVIILTYGLGNSLSASAQQILTNMAKQTTYDQTAGPIKVGHFKHIEDPSKLRSSMASYYNFFSKAKDQGKPFISVPYFDAFGLGMIVTVALPFYYKNQLKGVVALDLPIADLFANAIFNRHYIFAIDHRGRALLHPLLPQPNSIHSEPIVASIDVFERNDGFDSVLKSMKSGGSGKKSFSANHIITNGNSFRDGVTKQTLASTYYWKSIADDSFSVCLVMVDGDVEVQISGTDKSGNFLYHRIDLKAPSVQCNHFNRMSTKEKSVVKLSPECFTDPYQYLDEVETTSDVTALTNYLSHKSSTNPGLKADIREAITLLAKGDDIWLKELTSMAESLAWRYIATYNGVFRVVPGMKLQKDYNPVVRPWYRRAMSNPGQTVLSAPYLDAFGAGYVITLSYTLYKGNPSKTHTKSDTVVAVAGGDFTLGAFYQEFMKRFPLCEKDSYSCFVIDSSGFVVIHQDFVEAKRAVLPEVEDVHVTVKDGNLATLLISGGYMYRKKCLNVVKMDDQSTWKVDLASKKMVSLSKGTATYEVSVVSGSNIFIVVRKHGTDGNHGCSCKGTPTADSYKNYSCMLGGSSKTCECPCHSPANYLYCKDKLVVSGTTSSPCTPEAPALNVTQPSKEEKDQAKSLEFCYQTICKDVTEKGKCISSLGCSWCARAKDGGILQKQYCASEEVCYLGVVGMPSPYGPGYGGPGPGGGQEGANVGAIIGGVVGGIIFLVIIIIIAVVCHKKNMAAKSQRPPAEPSAAPASGHANPAMVVDPSDIELTPNAPPPANPHYMYGQQQPPIEQPPSYDAIVGYPGMQAPPVGPYAPQNPNVGYGASPAYDVGYKAQDTVESNDPRLEALFGGVGALGMIGLTYIIWSRCKKKPNRTTASGNTNTGETQSANSHAPQRPSQSLPVSNSDASLQGDANIQRYALETKPDEHNISTVSNPAVDPVVPSFGYPDPGPVLPSAPPPVYLAPDAEYHATAINHHLPPLSNPSYPPPAYNDVEPCSEKS